MALKDRLKTARKELGLTQAQVAEGAGMTQATYSQLERGIVKSSSRLIQISTILKVDPHWLSTGEGKPSTIDKNKQAVGNIRPVTIKPPKEVRYAPLLARVPAGEFKNTGDLTYDTYISYDQERASDDCYWLEVYGDSMEPDFNKGDLILVDAGRQAKAGDYVVANLGDGDSTFKRYKACYDNNDGDYVQLIALNSFYTPIDSRKVQFHVAGVVIEHRRTLK